MSTISGCILIFTQISSCRHSLRGLCLQDDAFMLFTANFQISLFIILTMTNLNKSSRRDYVLNEKLSTEIWSIQRNARIDFCSLKRKSGRVREMVDKNQL